MPASTLNPTQIHILEAFSFCKDESTLKELQKVLADFFAKKLQDEADALWDKGILDAAAVEKIAEEHWRTSYAKGANQ